MLATVNTPKSENEAFLKCEAWEQIQQQNDNLDVEIFYDR